MLTYAELAEIYKDMYAIYEKTSWFDLRFKIRLRHSLMAYYALAQMLFDREMEVQNLEAEMPEWKGTKEWLN